MNALNPAPQPVYMNDAYIPLLENRSRYLVLRGGGGSGKSVWAAQKMAIRLISERNHRLLVVRKVKVTLQQSVYQQILDVLSGWGMMGRITHTVSPLSIKCPDTDSEILFVGIDDPEKIKSITRITSIWIEEATELDQADFTQLNIRLRGAPNYYKQFIITFNPIDEKHWLKKRFFDTADTRATTMLSTYRDNYFLPEEDRQTLMELADSDPNYHRIYVLNEWGRIQTGQEFYFNFKRTQHVAAVPYLSPAANYGKPSAIFTAYDANVLPYSAMLGCQPQRTDEGLILRFFKEYALPPPQGGVRPTAKRFFADWKAGWRESDVFITGDATLRKREPGQTAERATLFEDVQSEMMAAGAWTPYADRWLRKNPEVARRGAFINAILAGRISGIRIVIDENCSELIADLEQVQVAAEGDKYKPKTKDKTTGQRYELRGHQSDCFDYLICTICEAQYEQFKAGR